MCVSIYYKKYTYTYMYITKCQMMNSVYEMIVMEFADCDT